MSIKLRWSNGHSFSLRFEANDPEEFAKNSVSALRSFRLATARNVHRGELHKTVVWVDHAQLGVYDEDNKNWYLPSGEPTTIDTASFGALSIARHFRVEDTCHEWDTLENMNYDIKLICQDPPKIWNLNLQNPDDSARIWGLCLGAYQHGKNMQSFFDGFSQDFEKLI